MSYNIVKLLEDYNIETFIDGKNTSTDWINIKCPICNDKSNHGGFNINSGQYNCWNCGKHHYIDILCELLNMLYGSVLKIIREEYTEDFILKNNIVENKKKIKNITLPGTNDLIKMYSNYLYNRCYNSNYIKNRYHVQSGEFVGEWGYRLIIPVYYNNKIVTCTGRTIIDEDPKYLNLSDDNSIISIKNCLYDIDNCVHDILGVVEGVMDKWRMGNDFCATFGTNITESQIRLMKQYKRIFFLFDNDSKAYQMARQAAYKLSSFNCQAEIIDIKSINHTVKDPDKLSYDEVQYIRKELGFKIIVDDRRN